MVEGLGGCALISQIGYASMFRRTCLRTGLGNSGAKARSTPFLHAVDTLARMSRTRGPSPMVSLRFVRMALKNSAFQQWRDLVASADTSNHQGRLSAPYMVPKRKAPAYLKLRRSTQA